jgi:hypothetical protein
MELLEWSALAEQLDSLVELELLAWVQLARLEFKVQLDYRDNLPRSIIIKRMQ